jgi:hypothetical protein
MTGSGTPLDPFVIWDVLDLQDMNLDLAAYYQLGQDIDASITVGWNGGLGFEPVGTDINRFTGSFDGKGHTISSLHINRPLLGYIGLIGYAELSTIQAITLLNANITGASATGALIGQADGCAVSNCHSSGSVTGTGAEIGGLIGDSYLSGTTPCTIDRCSSSCLVIGTLGDSGGLLGYSGGSVIDSCSATGNVTDSGSFVGGLIGEAAQCTISKCHATGNIHILSDYAGGLVGYSDGSTLEQCYATGQVTADGVCGGLCGGVEWSSTIRQSHATGNIDGGSGWDVGGLIGNIYESTVEDCYATGDVIGGDNDIGGLIGYCEESILWRSYATGNVTGSDEYVGGLIGYLYGGGGGAIPSTDYPLSQCYATGNVESSSDTVGGLIGFSDYGYILDCYARGNVVGFDYVGGLIGYAWDALVLNCYATGITSSPGDCGGFIGYSDPYSVTSCFWDVQASGMTVGVGTGSDAGITGKTTAEMKVLATFKGAGWNIENHASVDLAGGYPWLSWQYPGASPTWYIWLPPAPPPPPFSVVTLPATEIR